MPVPRPVDYALAVPAMRIYRELTISDYKLNFYLGGPCLHCLVHRFRYAVTTAMAVPRGGQDYGYDPQLAQNSQRRLLPTRQFIVSFGGRLSRRG